MSKLLINEPPLQVLPSLAKAIGLNEAIALQQLHYWLEKSTHIHDGRRWVYNTAADWQEQLPFWSEPTTRRVFNSLRKMGLVLTGNYNAKGFDKTLWYSIDYVALREISPTCDEFVNASDHIDQTEQINVITPIPETTQETTTDSSSSNDEAAPTGDKPSAPTPVSKKPKAKREPKPKQDSAAEKVPTEHQEMFGALCKLVGWDYAVITKEQAGQVAQTLGVLKKGDYTIEDLRKFYLYWRDKDWRGQKGQYPTLSLVRSEIGKIRLNGNGHSNGHIAPALAVFTGSEK